jgi:hypothetical protein
MSFFYNLNKTLDSIREKPELKHGQLNERTNSPVGEGLGDMARKVGGAVKSAAKKGLETLGHGDDAAMMRDLQKKMGVPQTGQKPQQQVKEKMNPAKAKSFAALAPPTDKITFADKIAGAKKEVDEMLGDVAAEAMKKAIGGRGEDMDEAGYSAKSGRAGKDLGKPGKNFGKIAKSAGERYGSEAAGERVAGAVLNKLRHKNESEMDEAFPTVAGARKAMPDRKVGQVTRGAKHDVEEIPGGRRVTRRTDPNTGYSVGADADDKSADSEKRGRGRPKSASKEPERVTAKATKHKGGRKTTEDYGPMEGKHEGNDELKAAMAMLKKAGYTITKSGAEELDEKAVSKKQQKFMGMVHATQKGEKAPSKAVAKVANTMKKGDAEDFASTKHKGLPEKKKPEGKKKEKTEEAGGTDTPTASSGFSYGKGIYDSMNHDLENMIKESMSRLDESLSINVSSSTEGGQNITVTASEEDAVKLADILKNAGIGGGDGYGGSGYKSQCGCGEADCSCGDEQVDENQPDWPTDEVQAQDNFEYSGGVNGPKSTGQTTVPVIAGQEDREGTYAAEEEDAIKRMMEMAGVTEAKKPDFLDVDKDGNKKEPFKKAVDDKKEKQVDESILTATANLWSEYKGKYGV